MRLEGKVAIVTGASAGIGYATAKLFCKEGAHVIAAARRVSRMQKLTRECTEAGYPGDITIVKTDVRVPDQIEHIYDVALEKFGTFDVVVNNAGVLDGMRPVHEVTDEIYDLVYETDQKSVFLSCRRAVQILLDQNKHGSIINKGSAASLRGLRGGLMYVTCKHAVLGMTRNISASYFERGIRCNCICPANIKTEVNKACAELGIGLLDWQMRAGNGISMATITPPGQDKPMLGKPSDVAKLCLFLADEKSSGYISGAEIKIDGSYLNM